MHCFVDWGTVCTLMPRIKVLFHEERCLPTCVSCAHTQVILLDLSWLLPGSPILAGIYKLGPSHPLPSGQNSCRQPNDAPKSVWDSNYIFTVSENATSEADVGTHADLYPG